ncbi:MAG: hypothetical protein LKE53_03065 [Oscillospiraceae bacterium]|nr:hypothetical protein [Oscillospiraceae bacterium]MDD3261254.1 hypothetical protein [Oscillospiraceae bacterium]
MENSSEVSWEKVYECWKVQAAGGPAVLNAPVSLAELHVPFEEENSIFYGYDWLSREEYFRRKETMQKDMPAFLHDTKATNQGTVYTLQMLLDTKDDEERAAVWIYAFAKDVSCSQNRSLRRYAYQLCDVSMEFLLERFFVWQRSMQKLLPTAFFCENAGPKTRFHSIEAVVELARLNAALLLCEYVPILYSSLPFSMRRADDSVRL